MTRAPILSVVAAALLLGLAIAGPAAAEDTAAPATPATPAAPAMTPAPMTPAPAATATPVKGEFDDSAPWAWPKGRR